jgi:hypothetical protein
MLQIIPYFLTELGCGSNLGSTAMLRVSFRRYLYSFLCTGGFLYVRMLQFPVGF